MSDNINKPGSNNPQDDESSESKNKKDLNKKESKDSDGLKSENPEEVPKGNVSPDGKDKISSEKPENRSGDKNIQLPFSDASDMNKKSDKPPKDSKKDIQKDNDSEKPNPIKTDKPSKEIKKDNDIQLSFSDQTEKPSSQSNRPKVSNYQISLIDENYLKVSVITKKGIKINSTLKENKKNAKIQNNEIYLNPKLDLTLQEVEIHISIDEDSLKNPSESTDEDFNNGKKLNDNILEENEDTENKFKVIPINENLLKVKIDTNKSVKIDSVAKDKKTSLQTQSNRILLLPDQENKYHQIEITIELDPEMPENTEITSGTSDDGKIKLIPNPEVVDLIQPPDYSEYPVDPGLINPEGVFINPFDKLRHLIRKNLTIGLVIASLLHIGAAGFAFYFVSKKSDAELPEEQPRIIVLQDLPDPKIKLQDVEDPNKPKIEEIPADQDPGNIPKREITPRRVIQPPRVNRPSDNNNNDSLPSTELERELDSLRRLADALESDTSGTLLDSLRANYIIPDSLRNNFSEQDIGLAMYFPNNWKLTDQRDINKNEKDFKGVVLTDTTAEQPGTMTMFVFLDNELKDFNTDDFKAEFAMNDTTLSGFVKEPKTLAGFTEYRFYIFNKIGTEKLSLRASVRKQYFDQYKEQIEAVVRSISIKKNINIPDSTKQAPPTIPDDSEDGEDDEESSGFPDKN